MSDVNKLWNQGEIYPTYLSENSMPRIKIQLVNVQCKDTEDVTGADELYLVGALVGGGITKAILTTPIDINDGEVKKFKPDQSILFEGNVPADESIKGGIKAYDEDAGKDWSKYGDTVTGITSAVSAVLAAAGPKGVLAGTILSASVKGVGILASLDKDDLLGSTELVISSTGPAFEEVAWRFKKTGSSLGYSDWDYTLRYRITRS
ncbi:hypothetical protein [Cylindrospermum stagnale]|nr:hypothetical protein [Cylindrospermum stagnale]